VSPGAVRRNAYKLNALRSDCDKPAGDRLALAIAQEMINAKMFLVRIDRFAQSLLFGSFWPSHANEDTLTFSEAVTVVSHHFLILEHPSLAELALLNSIYFS